jgi:hypothetical protein
VESDSGGWKLVKELFLYIVFGETRLVNKTEYLQPLQRCRSCSKGERLVLVLEAGNPY